MTQFRFSSLVAGLSLAAATSAGAQTANVTLTAAYAPDAGAVTAFGYYMSPYSGTVDGATARLNCVDFFHEVSLGEVWTANVTNLGAAIADNSLLSATRDGSSGGYASLGDVLKLYQEAAWLTAQMPSDPASDPNAAVAIQTAIWSLVDNGPTNPSSLQYASTNNYWNNGQVSTIVNSGAGSTGYWISRAQSEYALVDAAFYDNFNVLTGVGAGAATQEMLYATPEPGTLVLFGSGLIGIVGFVRIRRRKNSSESLAAGAMAS